MRILCGLVSCVRRENTAEKVSLTRSDISPCYGRPAAVFLFGDVVAMFVALFSVREVFGWGSYG